MICVEMKKGILGGGVVCKGSLFRCGEGGEKEKEERRRKGRWSGHILIITYGITNRIFIPVNPSVIMSVN